MGLGQEQDAATKVFSEIVGVINKVVPAYAAMRQQSLVAKAAARVEEAKAKVLSAQAAARTAEAERAQRALAATPRPFYESPYFYVPAAAIGSIVMYLVVRKLA